LKDVMGPFGYHLGIRASDVSLVSVHLIPKTCQGIRPTYKLHLDLEF